MPETPFISKLSPPTHLAHRPGARWRASVIGAVLCTGMAVTTLWPLTAQAADTSPVQQLQRFSTEAGRPAQAERGAAFFTTPHGGEWSCSSCHGKPPTASGKHAATGKLIEPLAPAFNAQAFTSQAKVDKWFRRNCNDVLKRDCKPDEKADVLAYLLQLKP